MAAETTPTTVLLPADLLERVDQEVREGKAASRDQLFADALRRELAAREREAIDAAFAGMADDHEYLAEANAIASEFEIDEWELFLQAERAE
jgi:metal-responsive CopG/Arc/MetJ family transcriptional regulator